MLKESLYEPETAAQIKRRIAQLRPESERQWGTMTPAQALAHCSLAMHWALGDKAPPRMFVGRIIGGLIKPLVLKEGAQMRRNSPTTQDLIVAMQPDFAPEQQRLTGLIDSFAAAGPSGCTKQPHSFFGPLKPEEWATLMYKHLDHHLRQFGV